MLLDFTNNDTTGSTPNTHVQEWNTSCTFLAQTSACRTRIAPFTPGSGRAEGPDL